MSWSKSPGLLSSRALQSRYDASRKAEVIGEVFGGLVRGGLSFGSDHVWTKESMNSTQDGEKGRTIFGSSTELWQFPKRLLVLPEKVEPSKVLSSALTQYRRCVPVRFGKFCGPVEGPQLEGCSIVCGAGDVCDNLVELFPSG